MLLRLLPRHLLHHWRVNLLVFVGLLSAAALLAGLPAYAATISGDSLTRRLANAPIAARNILITGTVLNEEFYGRLTGKLGSLVRERVIVRNQGVGANAVIDVAADDDFSFDEFFVLQPHSFSNLADAVNLVEGRLPALSPIRTTADGPLIEAVIGLEAATSVNFSHAEGGDVTFYNLQIGDQVATAPRENGRLRFEIVGIVEPKDPAADQWWGTLLPFSFLRQPLNGPSMPETITLSLLVAPEIMASHLPNHAEEWRVLTDTAVINVNNVNEQQSALVDVELELETNLVNVNTSLIEIIGGYLSELNTAQTTLFLLSFQSLLFVFYLLVIISTFVATHARQELGVLHGRGFTTTQVLLPYALSTLLLAVLAALLAPFVAQLLVGLWARLAERTAAAPTLVESWRLALLAAAAGWLTLLTVLFFATRGRPLRTTHFLAQTPDKPLWQRYYLDLILLLVGSLLYWQGANNNWSLGGLSSVAGAADPLLLVGPTLLLIAVTLLVVRLIPWLIRLAARWRSGHRFTSTHALQHLGRDPQGSGQVVFLISLAVGLALFAGLFRHSLSGRQNLLAHYLNGADVRLGLPLETEQAQTVELTALPGAVDASLDASLVYRNPRVRWAAELSRHATLLAVDPATLNNVARFPPGVSSLNLKTILPALETPGPRGIPAIFSNDSYPQGKQVGDLVTYIVGTKPVDFEVRGLISNFPGLSAPFVVTNLALLENEVDFKQLSGVSLGQKELWLAAEPPQQAALLNAASNRGLPLLNTAADIEQTLRSDLVGQEALGAFTLNAWLLTGLSLVAFLLAGFLAARQRHYELSILRTLGASPRQLLGLIGREGIAGVSLGLLAGLGIGYGLAVMMRPILSRVLSSAVGGDAIQRIMVDWTAVMQLLGIFILAYALVLLLLLFILSRSDVVRVLKVSVE